MKSFPIPAGLRCGLVAALGCALASCANQSGNYVVAATGTVIGLEVAQGATGSPALKLGYDRAELAYVPTNRTENNGTVTGADQTADVLMELRYAGIGSTSGDSGIYQRLAVGKNAVTQAGASVMFAKSANGTLDANAAAAISAANAVKTIPPSSETIASQLTTLRQRYLAATPAEQARYNEAATAAGYSETPQAAAFLHFTADVTTTQQKVDDVKAKLKDRGITLP